MKNNIEKFEKCFVEYNNLIRKYENISFNILYKMDNSSLFWSDNRSNKFYDTLKDERKKLLFVVENLNDLRDVYKLILDEYKKVENIVIHNPELNSYDRDKKNRKINSNEFDEIYESIFNNNGSIMKKYSLDDNTELADKKYKELKTTISYLDDINNKIKRKIGKMKINKIQENSISDLL